MSLLTTPFPAHPLCYSRRVGSATSLALWAALLLAACLFQFSARPLVSNGAVKLTSTYGYDGNTGELLTQTYNDGAEPIPTPSVTNGSYTRLGQVVTVTDGTGTRTFNYNASAPWRLDNETLDAGFYASRVLTRLYDGSSEKPISLSLSKTSGRPKRTALGFGVRKTSRCRLVFRPGSDKL